MPGQRPESGDRVNILFPMGDERADRTIAGPETRAFSMEEYQEAREVASQLDAEKVSAPETDPMLVSEVMTLLAGHKETRSAMFGPEEERTDVPPETLEASQLGEVGPPADRPFLIPEIGVLSVPNPAPEKGAGPVRSALSELKTDVVAEPSTLFHAIDAPEELIAEEDDGMASTLETYLESIARDEWLEAALEAGTAAEMLPWGVARVNAPHAWRRRLQGQGVRVAIVDTGVGPHIELGSPVASATFVPGTTSANDDHYHGTHVAGTILARRDRRGVVGVAPRASLIRAKVLDRNGSGHDTWIAAGIVWAANQGARVINLSLGAPTRSVVIDRAIWYATIVRKALVVAAAGNDYGRPVIFPARNPLCVAVAATDQHNRRAAFSNRGFELDLAAPGVSVLSTFPGNRYGVLNGTSMATPHVSGVAAIALSAKPWMGPFQTRSIMEQTAIPLGAIVDFGRGLVQADRVASLVTTPYAAGMPAEAEAQELAGAAAPVGRTAAKARNRKRQPAGVK